MMEKVEGCTVNFITVKLAESGCCSFRLVVQSDSGYRARNTADIVCNVRCIVTLTELHLVLSKCYILKVCW